VKKIPTLLKLGWGLCFVATISALLIVVLSIMDGASAHSNRQNLMMVRREIFSFLEVVALFCIVLLYGVAMWSRLQRPDDSPVFSLALAFCVALLVFIAHFPILLVISVSRWTCHWEIENTIRGSDHHTYCILHASPFTGAGHSVLSRRTGGNPVFFTLEILSDDYGGLRNREVIKAALTDKNPAARNAARVLMVTLKERDRKNRKVPGGMMK
jgi:hypothetical protein